MQNKFKHLFTTVSFQLICRFRRGGQKVLGMGHGAWGMWHVAWGVKVSFHQSQQSKCENIKAIFGLQHKHEELLTVFLKMLKRP